MKNLIKIKIKTYSYLNFLTFIEHKNISIFNIDKINDFEYECETTYMSFLKIKKKYRDSKIIRSNSLIILFLKVFSEKIVIFCLIVSSLFYILLSKITVEVKIEGTSDFLNNYIMRELKEKNIGKYKFSPSINELKIIEKDIYLSNLDKFDIFNIIKKGNYIIVNYQIKKKNLVLEELKGKLYSKKDAIISKILISTGNVLVKENDFVLKDQILVDDHILLNNEPYFVGTKGLIYGYTYNKVEISYTNFEEAILESRYLVSKDYIYKERILEENILYHDETNKKIVFHYKCEEILNN